MYQYNGLRQLLQLCHVVFQFAWSKVNTKLIVIDRPKEMADPATRGKMLAQERAERLRR